MKILDQWSRERYGNDSVLRYSLMIFLEWEDTYIQLSENHSGWNGKYTGSHKICMSDSQDDLTEAQRIINMLEDLTNDQLDRNQVLTEVMKHCHGAWHDYFTEYLRNNSLIAESEEE